MTPDSKHEHLEIHALVDGGYVIREGRFDGASNNGCEEPRWLWRQERAAFATLADALKWVGANMVDKTPTTAKSRNA